jgi:HlyD family secretion protein
MRRWVRRGLPVLALAAVAAALRLVVFRDDPVPVTVFRAERGRVEDTVSNSRAGTVASRRRAALSAEIGGRVQEILVREGDAVRRDQVLIRLYDADYRAQVELRMRSLEASRAAAREACLREEQADRDLTRYERLSRDAIVSEEIVEQVRIRRDTGAAACESATAAVGQAEAALSLARVELGKSVLRAPFDGVLAQLSCEVGEWITPSPPGLPMPAVLDIIDPEAIYVSAPLDEVDVAKVRQDMPVRVTLDAYAERSFPGRITRVAPFVLDVQEQNRTFEVEVELDDRAFARTLLPGTSADVEVILEARDGVLRIPSYALMEGSRVLVLRDGLLVAIAVRAGLKNWEFTEITAGLEPGEAVVVSLDRVEVQAGAAARIAPDAER